MISMAGQFGGHNPRLCEVPLSISCPCTTLQILPQPLLPQSPVQPLHHAQSQIQPLYHAPCPQPEPLPSPSSQFRPWISLCAHIPTHFQPQTVYQAPAPSRSLVSKHNLSLAGLYQAPVPYPTLAPALGVVPWFSFHAKPQSLYQASFSSPATVPCPSPAAIPVQTTSPWPSP